MIVTIQAPNRYRKMLPDYIPYDTEEETALHKKDLLDFTVPWHSIPKQKIVIKNNFDFWKSKFTQYKTNSLEVAQAGIQEEIRERQKIEYPQHGIPLGLGYSFDIYDQVLIWSNEPFQLCLGMKRSHCLFVFNNSLEEFN